MTLIGFSTGALAKGNFHFAIDILREKKIRAVELSALKEAELPLLVAGLKQVDLSFFEYRSVHVPSKFMTLTESEIVRLLEQLPGDLPLVVHPDAIKEVTLWRRFGARLLLENMDQRKRTGRDPEELEHWLDEFPDARVCFDIGHARQLDPTMSIAAVFLIRFRDRIHQIHMSEVTSGGSHVAMGFAAQSAFSRVSGLLPPGRPIIIESIVGVDRIDREICVVDKIVNGPEKGQVREGPTPHHESLIRVGPGLESSR